jgi:hypothetical protein
LINKADIEAARGDRPLGAHFDRCCTKDVWLLSRAVENLLDRCRERKESAADLLERVKQKAI